MNLNSSTVFRFGATILLSLIAWIGKDIRAEQFEFKWRLRIVEMNQVKIMANMGIEPCGLPQKLPGPALFAVLPESEQSKNP